MISYDFVKDTFYNFYANSKKFDLTYLVENRNWVISQIGDNIASFLNKNNLLKTRISKSPFFIKNQIVHYGSENILFGSRGLNLPDKSCKVIVSWFHAAKDHCPHSLISSIKNRISTVHTACNTTKKELIKLGIPENLIKIIPLGVDLKIFRKISAKEKEKIRRKMNLPKNRLIIGSFQKDGNGWGEGNEPKLIKGPDLLVEALNKLKKYNPFVLLSGPSRGFVKQKLKEFQIEYKHVPPKKYEDMPQLYNVIDIYIIPSRKEGGPRSLLEAMACGVPVVSTHVGMSNDLIKDGINGFFADFNPESIATKTIKLIDDTSLREKIIKNSEKTIMDFDEKKIAKRYFDELYSK